MQCKNCVSMKSTLTRTRAKPGFRVVVDASRVLPVGDIRASCYVWVSPRNGRPVSWLHTRLRAALGLPAGSAFALIAAGHLLPPDEPLHLLRPTDTLQILPLSNEDQSGLQSVLEDDMVDGVSAGERPTCTSMPLPPVVKQQTNEVPTTLSSSNTSAQPEATLNDSSEELIKIKEQALQLLNGYEISATSRRRRVRRRTRRKKSLPEHDELPSNLGNSAPLPIPAESALTPPTLNSATLTPMEVSGQLPSSPVTGNCPTDMQAAPRIIRALT